MGDMVMKYFNRNFSASTFADTFRSITDEHEMKIFTYEYLQWLKAGNVSTTGTEVRSAAHSLYYHMGWFQYGKMTGPSTSHLLAAWRKAVREVLYLGEIPCVLDKPVQIEGRRLEIITGEDT
jgi:hypothetical protein